MRKYTVNNIQTQIKKGMKFNFIGFWGNKNDTENEKSLSNFYKTKIVFIEENGKELQFRCSEQFFMYLKAKLFKDDDIATKILDTSLPNKEYQNLGRKVKNFDQSVWDSHKYDLMKKVVTHKVNQNNKIKKYLLETPPNTIFVETSPFDTVWGIGMTKKDRNNKTTNWKNPNLWKGENLLGFILTEIHEELLAELPRIDSWEELSKCKSDTHILDIDLHYGCGWILPKNRKDSDKFYLSTHSFYASEYKHSTELLQRCGFNVSLKSWG